MSCKILKVIISILFILILSVNVKAQDSYNGKVLKTGITIEVPQGFFGTWRVKSFLKQTNSPENFKKENVDIWNLSQYNDVIKLSNPFTGANATITLDYVEQKTVKFTRKGNYDGRILTDIVELTIDGDSFTGTNTLILEVLSDVDNSVIKTSKALYTLEGEKIAGGR